MKAIGHYKYLPIDDPESLVDVQIDAPKPEGRDLLVEVKAVSVNPVDTKRRAAGPKPGELKILGYDAAGVVKAAGPAAMLFKPGDAVYYAGSNQRPGTNSELHLVDERVVGHKPEKLSFAEAAALPLTTITAWEGLFERLGISKTGGHEGRRLLILGGAGGVGSIAIQLAKKLARLRVTASASRPESIAWVSKLGADATVDHSKPLPEQLGGEADYVLICTNTDPLFPALPKITAPQGRICSIVRTLKPVDLAPLQEKSLTFAWEGMFTRSTFQTPDMQGQHELLEAAARHFDAGTLVTTFRENLGRICAANLRVAHRRIEQGHTIGKLVLEGF
ncbi:MAG: zinc-binding alcohol dehydrogenase family protein [Betaproteobacteria bacterium]|nr:zinc-binding alcohol dehydrogenase family protein [Betaproteobacteria bacterium]MDH5222518.1 zinc-binding alcohol dehydrogenase family protein [Betaproteobacteria bacterium]MDH5350049.1 zinc-binding alcohol dehydrogenase family protein [Betaproteobacteria bacterium]